MVHPIFSVLITKPELKRLGTVEEMTKMPKTRGVTEPPSRACTGAPSTC
jgi:hypothetical protein